MRIGLLTFHYAENKNFGAILQTYAIQKLIKKVSKLENKMINYDKNK